MKSQNSLPYHEPGIATVLTQGGLLLALNLVNAVLDRIIYCGLIGQLLVGMAWGVPGANWLALDVQQSIQQLGYIGLLLLVYEGGLSTSFAQLKSNFIFSALVAITGVGVPMGLSFVLMSLLSATPLQAFAAGAALCSTSIGTTFTILSTTGLAKTRLGVVLGSAAMMDDVMGLVMVQIISNLGSASSSSSFDPVVVIRPILVALGFAVGLVLICRFVVLNVVRMVQDRKLYTRFPQGVTSMRFLVVMHMCLLIGLVAGATYAGTSGLFAAYLAGASISWFDELISSLAGPQAEGVEPQERHNQNTSGNGSQPDITPESETGPRCQHPSGEQVFERFCKEPLKRILSPLFFVRTLLLTIYKTKTNIRQASIGFSIPITEMFKGQIVWRGMVYTVLMMFSKVITGIWLVQINLAPPKFLQKIERISRTTISFCFQSRSISQETDPTSHTKKKNKNRPKKSQGPQPREDRRSNQGQGQQKTHTDSTPNTTTTTTTSHLPPKPRSLYPASILGLAMVARGEIGYLIASLAETDGVFSSAQGQESNGSTELYLVVVWAITLCTVLGPICVGTLVKRVRTLTSKSGSHTGREYQNPLGTWGVTS